MYRSSGCTEYQRQRGAAITFLTQSRQQRGNDEYEVDEIVKHRVRRRGKSKSRTRKLEYLVFWTGYPAHEATWEPKENLQNAQEKLQQYYQRIEGNAENKEGGL